jgi:uncharacterized protein
MTTRAELSRMAADASGHTPLMVAALNGDRPAINDLLAVGCDVNARDHEGRTALMFAVINMHSEAAKLLIEHIADVNAKANDGGTPLMLAVTSGDEASVRLLLSHNADLSGRYERTGETALRIAQRQGYDDIARLLQQAGAKD